MLPVLPLPTGPWWLLNIVDPFDEEWFGLPEVTEIVGLPPLSLLPPPILPAALLVTLITCPGIWLIIWLLLVVVRLVITTQNDQSTQIPLITSGNLFFDGTLGVLRTRNTEIFELIEISNWWETKTHNWSTTSVVYYMLTHSLTHHRSLTHLLTLGMCLYGIDFLLCVMHLKFYSPSQNTYKDTHRRVQSGKRDKIPLCTERIHEPREYTTEKRRTKRVAICLDTR